MTPLGLRLIAIAIAIGYGNGTQLAPHTWWGNQNT